MKKNITINLFGTLYQMDEDAYELLKSYQDNMRSYYIRREGGEEIADDVERRVAELLDELCAAGVKAITIEHVQDIIHRIGDPQQMDGEDSAAATAAEAEPAGSDKKAVKRLYRDPDDKILGGVISGLCHYFGWKDPLVFRLLFAILCVFSSAVLAVVYAVCWALIPEAVTAEDRLEMRGKPVTPRSLNEEIMKGMSRTKEYVNDPHVRRKANGCLVTFLKVGFYSFISLGVLFFGLLLFCVLIFLMAFFVSQAGLVGVSASGLLDEELAMLVASVPSGLGWMLGVSAVLALLIPLCMLVRTLIQGPNGKRMSAPATISLVVVWFLAMIVMLCSLAYVGRYAETHFGDHHHRIGLRFSQSDPHAGSLQDTAVEKTLVLHA